MSQETENRDYESKPSVLTTGSVKREKDEPKLGLEPLSLGLFAICAGALIVGGGYLGAKSGGFDFGKTAADIADPKRPNISDDGGEVDPVTKYVMAGQSVYRTVCNGCHQANGGGQGQIPPLVNSEWVNEGTERFAQIILNGIRGPISVGGASYGAQEMPGQKAALSDTQVAQVMTYVRHQFGGLTDSVVTKEMVADARNRFGDRAGAYTASELSSADTNLPGDQPEWAQPQAAEGEGGESPGGDEPAAAGEANQAS